MAFLVMNRNTDSARDRLLEIFWPDADPDHARDSLSTALHSIRRCLRFAGVDADGFLTATKSTVRWTADTTVDALQFSELASRNDSESSQTALQLYRGDFLEGDYDNWTTAERERLAALYERVLARLVKTSKDADAAQRFIERNPYDEEAYAAIVEAELAAGRHSAAAAWVERCRKALSEVGGLPSSEFEARFGLIVHVEPLKSNELALPFTGRETELALLAARIADAAKRHGSITLVHGEAGVGKTTLLNRSAQVATEHGLRTLTVRGVGEDTTSFGPWRRIFADTGAGDFDIFVKAHPSDLPTAVAHAINTRLTEPSLLIVDDAHEMTGDALDIFLALVQAAITEHAIFAGVRPEGVLSLRSRLADVPLEDLPVGCLDRNAMKWALDQALGSEQQDVLNVLYDRTGGHPLFFTGLLNSLIGADVLTRDGHHWRLAKPIDADAELPDTVRRFIETRLHARGAPPRSVACALALEPTASADDLAAVLHLDEATTLDALDDLLALGVITQPPSGAPFAFSHDLIREVAAAGLNAGRRAALHRAFAQRLAASGRIEASLRLARHLQAAGEPLSAARSYLKSAEEALSLNASQDATDRCAFAIAEAEKLEHSADRAILLAALHRTAARAAMASGDANGAVRQAREAVNVVRTAEDLRERTLAVLDLAEMEGVAFHVVEQRSDAAVAAENARLLGDLALEAQALVQQANAACELGLREEALQASRTAHRLALKCGLANLSAMALDTQLRAQLTWWLFGDALETARIGRDAARLAEPFVEAALLHTRSCLWYLLGRFDDAESEIHAALRIANDAATRRHDSLVATARPQPYLQFYCYYMTGKIAAAQERWDKVLEAVDSAAALTNISKLPRHSEALLLLRIDALLKRAHPGDDEIAATLVSALSESSLAQGILGWSDCTELARARVAARLRLPDANVQLRRTVDTIEENAHSVPLDADVAFARLSEAAAEVNEIPVLHRARNRSNFYKFNRIACAGAGWGGEAVRVTRG